MTQSHHYYSTQGNLVECMTQEQWDKLNRPQTPQERSDEIRRLEEKMAMNRAVAEERRRNPDAFKIPEPEKCPTCGR